MYAVYNIGLADIGKNTIYILYIVYVHVRHIYDTHVKCIL